MLALLNFVGAAACLNFLPLRAFNTVRVSAGRDIMKNLFALFTLSGICVAFTPVYAGDGNTVPPVVSAVRISYPHLIGKGSMPPNLLLSNSDIRSQFLFGTTTQTDIFKNMNFRSAVAGAGILGAIMGGKIAVKFWIAPKVCFAPGIDIGSKRADFTLTF